MLLQRSPALKKVLNFCQSYPMMMQRLQLHTMVDFKLISNLIFFSFLMFVNWCTLSVSLNKIGDLKYYDGDLEAARSHYFRSLEVRRSTMKNNPTALSQVLDVAVSLAKVADVDRGIGNEDAAVSGFREALSLLESFKINSNEQALEQRRLS